MSFKGLKIINTAIFQRTVAVLCKPNTQYSLQIACRKYSQKCIDITPLPKATDIQWNYTDKGPSKWSKIFPTYADGNHQSPVDIVTKDAIRDDKLLPFSRDMFNKVPEQMLVSNSGSSLVFEIKNGYTIPQPHLTNEYAVRQFHFHWAESPDGKGSEHTLDGRQEFAELHIVHYNTKYPNFESAVDKKDGLAVFGVFIAMNEAKTNAQFDRVLSHINHVPNKGKWTKLNKTFCPTILLPGDLGKYFYYNGSLTTPMFNESVSWIVFKEPITISREQASVLSGEMSCDECGKIKLNGNFRPPQPLNKRTIFRSF